MKRPARFGFLLLTCGLMAIGANRASAQSTAIVFDDFNTNEGHFASSPGASGSSNGFQKTVAEGGVAPNTTNPGTAVQDTVEHAEGLGSEKIVLFDDLDTTTLAPNGGTARLRFLSGGGVASLATTNTRFQTTAGDDGWIGLAVKTLDPGWTAQIYIEFSPTTAPTVPGEHNGSVPKAVINDGQWHIYDWSLDDFTGGADGWTSVAGIIGNATSVTVIDGFHTIDSVIFRQTSMPVSSTIYMDYVVKTATGHVTLPGSGGMGADFNGDLLVDGADFKIWQQHQAETGTTQPNGDANGDGNVDAADLAVWQGKYGGPPAVAAASSIPEPAGLLLAVVAMFAGAGLLRR